LSTSYGQVGLEHLIHKLKARARTGLDFGQSPQAKSGKSGHTSQNNPKAFRLVSILNLWLITQLYFFRPELAGFSGVYWLLFG
jgi:hypothetical protein